MAEACVAAAASVPGSLDVFDRKVLSTLKEREVFELVNGSSEDGLRFKLRVWMDLELLHGLGLLRRRRRAGRAMKALETEAAVGCVISEDSVGSAGGKLRNSWTGMEFFSNVCQEGSTVVGKGNEEG